MNQWRAYKKPLSKFAGRLSECACANGRIGWQKLQLRSYPIAHRGAMTEAIHVTDRYANNRVEQSHEATRVRERGMRKFKSIRQAQRFLGTHAAVSNLFNLGRHLVGAQHYRDLRVRAFSEWSRAVA